MSEPFNQFIPKIEIECAKVLTEPIYNRIRCHIHDVSLDDLIQDIGAEKVARAIGIHTCVAAFKMQDFIEGYGKEQLLNILMEVPNVRINDNSSDRKDAGTNSKVAHGQKS